MLVFALFSGGFLALYPGSAVCQKQVDYLQVVEQAKPTVSLASSASLLTIGSSVTFTAKLTGAGGPPSGAVTFIDGASPLGTSALNGVEIATFSTSSLGTGSHSITASYGGDANYLPATSSPFVLSIVGPPPTLTVTPSSSIITSAQPLMVTVAATGNPTPTGTVELASGSYTSAPTTLSNGSATFNIPPGSLSLGTVNLTASYKPDNSSSFSYSGASSTVSITVMPATPIGTFTLTNSGNIALRAGATTGNTSGITVAPVAGFMGFVSLSCSVTTNLVTPVLPKCLLGTGANSTTVVAIVDSAPATTTLTVQTTAAANAANLPLGDLFLSGGSTTLAFAILFCFPTRRRSRRAAFAMLLLLPALAGGGAIACGGTLNSGSGSNPATTPGSYTIIVSGVAGTTKAATAVNLTVR
jgi:Bacterial Ig-like domain (group 3)